MAVERGLPTRDSILIVLGIFGMAVVVINKEELG
jgi:hypothetical protein